MSSVCARDQMERDPERAYDRIPRKELWYYMMKARVPDRYVRIERDMYEDVIAVRCKVGVTDGYDIKVGLHQGSALDPS